MRAMMFNDCFCLTEAVIEKRKLQTRRIEKGLELLSETNHEFDGNKVILHFEASDEPIIIRPRYKVGEIVAVAQSYKDAGMRPTLKIYNERTDKSDNVCNTSGWTNKMFVQPELMPHKIQITKVRLERLQDISDRDCLQEGVRETEIRKYKENPVGDIEVEVEICSCLKKNDGRALVYPTPREAFAALIDKTSGKGTWNRNPYVFVYDFKLVR
ncbi:hypothetical protein [Porphyromonas endodontalis]|uniref:hypothetical protein n=1 Tax=Porphyromonas endodontalis TaxID=28124 RepID=UPI0028EB342B|nr:hypothetical protein [Porphyromonas endodontalis]